MPVPSDSTVFATVRALVDAGEYLDQVLGTPQPTTAGGGGFRVRPDGYARMFDRGSEEHLAAKAAGLVEPLPTPPRPPATIAAVEEAEALLGHRLPPLLRRLYLEVSNGGFGPGYGLLGLRDGHGGAPDGTALDRMVAAGAGDGGRPGLLPVCDWGCAIVSFVECSGPDARMWGYDPNADDDDAAGPFPHEMGFGAWLWAWSERRLHQPWSVQDPLTGAWRGATFEETELALSDLD